MLHEKTRNTIVIGEVLVKKVMVRFATEAAFLRGWGMVRWYVWVGGGTSVVKDNGVRVGKGNSEQRLILREWISFPVSFQR